MKEVTGFVFLVCGFYAVVCVFCVCRLIPTEVVESAVKTAVSDTRISDNAVNAALRRMMDWLVWPTCWNLDQWIICFLKELAIAKKFSILISVTESKVEQVRDRSFSLQG